MNGRRKNTFANLLTGEEIAKILHVSRAYAYQLMR
jgi:hypothetical protein